MGRAKELRDRASEYKIYTAPGQTGYGVDHSKYREWPAVEEICSKTYPDALDEISRLQEQIANLRAALKVERAMRHQYFLEEDQDLMVDAWNHCGNNIREECMGEAESELQREGLID